MSKAWKEFERFVARVEALLAPANATVKSPDRIREVATQRLREVDGSIRFKLGTAPILITLECREKARVQDQTWIEQLVTKKESVGAAKTIAVSSKGMSAPAVELARRKGIETRVMHELNDDIIRQWISNLNWGIYHTRWRILRLRITLADGTRTHNEIQHACRCFRGADAANQRVFKHAILGECSANELVNELVCIKGMSESGLDLPFDGNDYFRGIAANYATGSLSLRNGAESVPVRRVAFDVEMANVLVGSNPNGQFGEYKNEESSLCYAGDFTTRIEGRDGLECTLSFRKDIATQETSFGFSVRHDASGEIWKSGLSPLPGIKNE